MTGTARGRVSAAGRTGHRERKVDGHAARRRFGQHFLVDRRVIESIVRAVAPAHDDHVVEVGPGLGALTEELLAALAHLSVIEIDRDLAARLRHRFPPERLSILETDVLAVDWTRLAGQIDATSKPLRIVGNLPYNISSPLLVGLIASRHLVHDQHFMLQREVVERIVAGPGPESGRLGLLLQAFYACEPVLEVPPEAFDPPPRVHSAVVRMCVLAKARVADARTLSELLAVAFSRRRKMIRSTLLPWLAANGVPDVEIDGALRPEQIPGSTWYELADRLHAQRQAKSAQSSAASPTKSL